MKGKFERTEGHTRQSHYLRITHSLFVYSMIMLLAQTIASMI